MTESPTPDAFARWLEQRGLRSGTVRVYTGAVEPLWTSPPKMVEGMVIAYGRVAGQVAAGSRTPASGNVAVAALRSLAKFLNEQGVPTKAEWNGFPSKRRTLPPLLPAELDRLLDAPSAGGSAPLVQARDAAILTVLLDTGLKTGTLAALRRFDVTPDHASVTKNGEEHELSHHARHWLATYLGRRRDRATPLFVRHDNAGTGEPKPLTSRSIERMVRRYAAEAGIVGRVTPERLRAARPR